MYYWLSIALFVAAYAMIIVDKIHRTVVVWVAAGIALLLGVISQETAVREAIDFNTLWLLIGMMVIVGIMRKSGVFEYVAIWAARMTGGRPILLMVVLAVITGVLSSLLNNVTTVMLIIPMTIAVTDRLEISAMPFFISQILASNIGGTATLIGDPPNIMVGSATGLGFMDFVVHLSIPALIILLATMACLVLVYRKDLVTDRDKMQSVMELNPVDYIKEWDILKKSLIILLLTIAGFIIQPYLKGMEAATVALMGAGLLLLWVREDPEEALLTVEWPTIFFFGGLFVLVGGLVANGVIDQLAHWTLSICGTSPVKTGLIVLWVSAVGSAFVDNIPFVATMIPLLQTVGQLSHMGMEPIWWALVLGACLGGNGTLIGASANVIVAGMAERYGYHIGFIDYLKIGFPLMLLSIVISTAYLYLVYWM